MILSDVTTDEEAARHDERTKFGTDALKCVFQGSHHVRDSSFSTLLTLSAKVSSVMFIIQCHP